MILALMLAAAAPPPEPLRLETRMLAEQRDVAPDGTTRTTLVKPARAAPGDVVVVQLNWRNTGTQPIAGLVIANPVPRGLAYRGPRDGGLPELSVDGRRFGALGDLRVDLPTGGTRPATPTDVTHVRWRLPAPVAAGASGNVAFQAAIK